MSLLILTLLTDVCVLFKIFAATASSCQIKVQLTGFSLYFGNLLRTRSIFWISSTVVLNCQIKAHQAECVKATEGVLKDLLATPDQEVLHLLKEAAKQEKGEFYSVHGTHPLSDLFLHSPEMGMGTLLYHIVLSKFSPSKDCYPCGHATPTLPQQ